MIYEVLVFTAIALLLCVGIWWSWTQKRLAERQAQMNAELAELGKGLRSIAHDLHHSFDLISAELERARLSPTTELRDTLDGVRLATRSAVELVHALEGEPRHQTGSGEAADGLVRLGVMMLRSSGVPIDLIVNGALGYSGSEVDAMRVIQNLLSNAVRETARIADGIVDVELTQGCLRISNPVQDASLLDSRIYEEEVSYNDSSGLGLPSARAAAERIGWQLRHELADGSVHFYVEPKGTSKG